jgi:tetratricopeptide (TPR) repeat protein
VEAYLSALSGDNPRAQDAYISAVEIGVNQPQVHLLYGGFFLRTFNDPDTALEQFKAAIELDGKSSFAQIEAARATLYLSDFEVAQEYLNNAVSLAPNDSKTQQILCDLQVQIFWRKIEFVVNQNEESEIIISLNNFASFIAGLSVTDIDGHLVSRFQNYLRSITSFKGKGASKYLNELANLEEQINDLLSISGITSHTDNANAGNTSHTMIGELKKAGQRPGFGFIVDLEGTETFVSQSGT